MIAKNCDGRVPEPGALDPGRSGDPLAGRRAAGQGEGGDAGFRPAYGPGRHLGRRGEANRYFARRSRGSCARQDPARMATVLYVTAEVLRAIAIMAQPFVPSAAAKLLDLLGDQPRTEPISKHAGRRTASSPTRRCRNREPIFPRYVEAEVVSFRSFEADAEEARCRPLVHVRDRDREQHPDHQQRPHAHRPDGEVRPLQALARPISSCCRNSASASCATGRPCTRRSSGPGATTGRSPTSRSAVSRSSTSFRSSTSATSACRTGSAISRTRTFPSSSPTTPQAFAERFPWVQLYTPVNEMFICAHVLGCLRLVERAAAERQALRHGAEAHREGQRARHVRILEVRPDAIFIQSESSEYFHAENPAAIKPAEIMNARRFLSLDLNYGRRVDSEMYEYLLDNGMTREEYHFFLRTSPAPPLHHGQRLLRHQRAPRGRRRLDTRRRRVFGYDEITRSTTTATSCR